MKIEYRSISDMNNAILRNLQKFPHDVDIVVGIPRSGMLPANLLALYLNKPFTDIDSFIEGRIYNSGLRGNHVIIENTNKVLIMDDSICTGTALEKVKRKIDNRKEYISNYNLIFGVVFATKETKRMVDIYCETVEMMRAFQWNLFNHAFIIPKSTFDIDGVLCPNPPIDDDGPLYLEYISSAPVLYRPSLKIDTIISCRLEKYRTVTEKWLRESGIEYNKLIMLNLDSKEERIKWGQHGKFKGDLYKKSDNILFVESSLKEACVISQISRKPVFCTENFQMINNETIIDLVEHATGVDRFLNKIKHLKK